MKFTKKEIVLSCLLVIGMLLSLYLLYEHFSPIPSKICVPGEIFDCGVVAKSPYANVDGFSNLLTEVWGLPIPLVNISDTHVIIDFLTSHPFIAFLTLLFVLLLLFSWKKHKQFLWIPPYKALAWLRGIITASMLYGFYLLYIQHSVIRFYCIFCLLIDVVLISSFILIWMIKR